MSARPRFMAWVPRNSSLLARCRPRVSFFCSVIAARASSLFLKVYPILASNRNDRFRLTAFAPCAFVSIAENISPSKDDVALPGTLLLPTERSSALKGCLPCGLKRDGDPSLPLANKFESEREMVTLGMFLTGESVEIELSDTAAASFIHPSTLASMLTMSLFFPKEPDTRAARRIFKRLVLFPPKYLSLRERESTCPKAVTTSRKIG
mmetsp:Transcript_42136/g.68375  ORF Transcript_42136/g.68375 Transcript_42136/m.68375 type:complete len:208 (+) Transcript_42136:1513-2136(+)